MDENQNRPTNIDESTLSCDCRIAEEWPVGSLVAYVE
jgi:hypothetical protein